MGDLAEQQEEETSALFRQWRLKYSQYFHKKRGSSAVRLGVSRGLRGASRRRSKGLAVRACCEEPSGRLTP